MTARVSEDVRRVVATLAVALATGACASTVDTVAHRSPGVVAGLSSAVVADGPVAEPRWTYRLTPYVWAADVDGDLEVEGDTIDIDVPFSDTLDNLDEAFQGLIEARCEDWVVLFDTTYLDLSVDGEIDPGPGPIIDLDVDVDTQLVIAGAGVMRQLSSDSPLELGLGIRYLDLDVDVEITGQPDTDRSSDFVDYVVMGRNSWPLCEDWRLAVYGDVGAGDSDLTWQAAVTAVYDLGGWSTSVGYRMLDYDIGGSNDVDLTLSGVVLGANFRF